MRALSPCCARQKQRAYQVTQRPAPGLTGVYRCIMDPLLPQTLTYSADPDASAQSIAAFQDTVMI